MVHEELWAKNGVTGTDYRWAGAKASWGSLEVGHGRTSCWDGHEWTGAQVAGLGTSFQIEAKVFKSFWVRSVSLENWIWPLVLCFPAS